MILVLLALILVGVLALLLVLRGRRSRPTHVARARLDAKIANLRGTVSALQMSDREYLPQQEAVLREQWLKEQLSSRTVESLEVSGIGEGILETLREHGIRALQDLELMRHKKVPGVGEKRAGQLWSAYRDEREKLQRAAKTMSADELDRVSNGRLHAAAERHAAEELQRVRDLEFAQVQLTELERRRSQLA